MQNWNTIDGIGDSVQKAIDDATMKARQAINKRDARIAWKLIELSGVCGEIGSTGIVTAKIDYSG